jgi:hypothetical protein
VLNKSKQLRVVMVFLSLLLVTGPLSGSAKAASNVISKVIISDVRDISFTVSWVTDIASNGSVFWGTATPPLTQVFDAVSSTTIHSVTISGLSPNHLYYFYVQSGSDVDNNGNLYYQVTTGPTTQFPPPVGNTIWGYVYRSNGTTVVPNAIVYLQIKDANSSGSLGNSQLVSARADGNGVWSYNLGNIRLSTFQDYFSFTYGADNLRLIGQGGSQGTKGLDPTPFIITVPATNFYQQDIVLSQAPTAATLTSFSGSLHPYSIRLDWVTGTETDLLGFNLYRSETSGGVKNKLNSSLIQPKTPGGPTGNSYQYLDGTVKAGKTYFYWIELVMRNGGNQESGPVSLSAYWIWLPTVK